MTNALFDCDYCDGKVVMSTGTGRSHDFRTGIVLEIPEEFATAACQSCGRSYLTTEEAEQLDRLFETKLAEECRTLVARIQSQTGLSQKQVELAAGVTPTYLSHVMAGRKQPSATLFGLLECLARHPTEALRRIEHMHWAAPLPQLDWIVENTSPTEGPVVSVSRSPESQRRLRLVCPSNPPLPAKVEVQNNLQESRGVSCLAS